MKLFSGLSLVTAGVACSGMVQADKEGRKTAPRNSMDNEPKPSVILIMADDMGVECLGCYGGLSYDTPYLDQMAEQGKRFTHCYSQPLSTPSRVKIMTGKYNYRNYEDFGYLNPKEKTFGNVMKEAGYATSIVGKWQLNGRNEHLGWQNSDRPKTFGFDEYTLWQLTKKGNRYADPLIEQNGRILKGMENEYGPDIFLEHALDFIERKKDQPFFLYYPMVLPHFPLVPTPDSEEWHDKEKRSGRDEHYFKDMVEYTDKLVGKIIHPVSMEHVSWEVIETRKKLQDILDQAPDWEE